MFFGDNFVLLRDEDLLDFKIPFSWRRQRTRFLVLCDGRIPILKYAIVPNPNYDEPVKSFFRFPRSVPPRRCLLLYYLIPTGFIPTNQNPTPSPSMSVARCSKPRSRLSILQVPSPSSLKSSLNLTPLRPSSTETLSCSLSSFRFSEQVISLPKPKPTIWKT